MNIFVCVEFAIAPEALYERSRTEFQCYFPFTNYVLAHLCITKH